MPIMRMTTRGKTRLGFLAVWLSRGSSVVLLLLLLLGASETGFTSQAIKIRLVNGKNGSAMAGTCVNVWVGHERKAAMAIPTDKDGVAWLYLTDKAAEINTQNQWRNCGDFGVINPVVKYEDALRINAGYVLCQQHGPDYSWLRIEEFSTQQVLRQGIATLNTCGKATASPAPGEVIIFVRPFHWWEKLKQ
jgi:hypothetical protein